MADRRKRNSAADAAAIATELRSEVRRIIRKWYGLQTPLQTFREFERPEGRPSIQVCFGPSLLGDSPPEPAAAGLRCGTNEIGLPDERIDDAFHDFAGSVWHLGDRIHKWDRAMGAPGARSAENFNMKAALLGVLILRQIAYFTEGSRVDLNREETRSELESTSQS